MLSLQSVINQPYLIAEIGVNHEGSLDMAKKMMALKRDNNKKYAKELDYQYATYAFDKCYKKPKTQKRKSKSPNRKTRKRN